MTTDKTASVFKFYRQWMHDNRLVPIDWTTVANSSSPWDFMHLAYMCDTAVNELLPAGKTAKAMRWLGFLQGVLVTRKLFTLEEVKRHSKPEGEARDAGRRQDQAPAGDGHGRLHGRGEGLPAGDGPLQKDQQAAVPDLERGPGRAKVARVAKGGKSKRAT